MALRLTLKARERRQTVWANDPALGEIDEGAYLEWIKDGEARHLLPFQKPGEEATVFYWQSLGQDESRFVTGIEAEHVVDGNRLSEVGRERSIAYCFRMGVRFPSKFLPADYEDKATGQKVSAYEYVGGIRMLSDATMDAIREEYPGMIAFYGLLIRRSTFMTEAQKKALSPPSIRPRSSEDPTPSPVDTAALEPQG